MAQAVHQSSGQFERDWPHLLYTWPAAAMCTGRPPALTLATLHRRVKKRSFKVDVMRCLFQHMQKACCPFRSLEKSMLLAAAVAAATAHHGHGLCNIQQPCTTLRPSPSRLYAPPPTHPLSHPDIRATPWRLMTHEACPPGGRLPRPRISTTHNARDEYDHDGGEVADLLFCWQAGRQAAAQHLPTGQCEGTKCLHVYIHTCIHACSSSQPD